MTTALENLQAMLDAALAAEVQAPAAPAVGGLDLDPRLHGYQRVAVDHLHRHPKAGLFLEMGLGKTAATLQALTPEHLPALVIAPKRVAENVWPVEVPKWRSDLTIAVAAGTPAKRAAALASGADIVAIGRDNVKDLQPGQFRTIVIDELSGFKSRGARWKIVKKITDAAPYVWGLTGTPVPNGYMDLWTQIYLLDSGKALGRTLGSADPRYGKPRPDSYRGRFFFPARTHRQTGVIIEWGFKDGAKDEIDSRLSAFCLSMKARDYLELPPVTYNPVVVPLAPAVRKVYDRMLSTMVASLEGGTYTAGNAAILTGRLSQITAGFLYPDVDEVDGATTDLHSEKASAALEIVEGTGSPVLVFYRFKRELAILRETFPEAHTIDEPGVLDAWNRGEVDVLLAHPASAGHGLNLQAGGHTIVWTTMPWSLEEWEQANARLARQGQEHPVIVHQLISPDTVDEAIVSRLEGKATVQEALMMALKR